MRLIGWCAVARRSAGVTDADAAAAGVCKGKFCCPGCDAEQSVQGTPSLINCSVCKMMVIRPAGHATVEGSVEHKQAAAREAAELKRMPKWMRAIKM